MSTVSTTLLEANLPGLHLRHRGKVRDVFDLGDERLLIVATDRLSAFDVVLPDPIPGKGEMLCQISNFWFDRTASLMPNHLTGIEVAGEDGEERPQALVHFRIDRTVVLTQGTTALIRYRNLIGQR